MTAGIWSTLALRSAAMVVQTAVNEVPQSEAAAVRNLAALIEGMRIGQERALEELYDATVGKLYALASKREAFAHAYA